MAGPLAIGPAIDTVALSPGVRRSILPISPHGHTSRGGIADDAIENPQIVVVDQLVLRREAAAAVEARAEALLLALGRDHVLVAHDIAVGQLLRGDRLDI